MTRAMLSRTAGEAPDDEMRHLLYALVMPRPIAWVSTLSADGVANLAPHSFFNAVSGVPPVVMFASTRPHGGGEARKDTLRNVLETGEFVVNLVSRDMAEAMNATSETVPAAVDEFVLAGLEKRPSVCVKPFRVAEAAAALECRLHSTAEVGDATVVYGSVVHISVAEDVMTNGRPDSRKLSPVSRLGGSLYADLGDIFSMKRP